MTTVLTVAPLGGADMTDWCGGWAERQGSVREVASAADLSVSAIPDAALELDSVIHETLTGTRGDVIVFAHSQGCQVAGEYLRRHANADPSRLRFVLTGNLERAYFGYAARKPKWVPAGNIRGLTPDDSGYRVDDIGRRLDLWANYPGGLLPMLVLPFNRQHLDYSDVNPDELPAPVKVVGATRYYTVP